MSKIVALQYLRAFAAIGVVIGHATGRYGAPWVTGVAGVDLFFILSGFMMTLITDDTTKPWRFAFDRITRIVPLYWLATSVMLAGAVLHLFPRMNLAADYVVKSYLFIPARAPGSTLALPLVPHGWTLNFEMMFYAVFLLLLALPARIRPWTLAGLALIASTVSLLVPATDPILATYTSPLVLEFAAGSLLGQMWKTRARSSAGSGLACIAIGIAGFALFPATEAPIRVLYFGAPAFFLVIGALLLENTIRTQFMSRVLLLFGDASYSIYLWHGLLISLSLPLSHILRLPPWAGLIFAVAAAICGGTLGHRLIEIPLTMAVRKGHRSLTEMQATRRARREIPITD